MTETLSKLGTEGNFLKWTKNIYSKPIDNIILDKKLEAFLVSLGMKHRCPPSPFLFNIITEVLAKYIYTFLFTDDMTVYAENLKEYTKTLLELISDYSNVAGHKVNIQKSIAFLYSSHEQVVFEIKT